MEKIEPLTAKEAAFAILIVGAPILGAFLLGKKLQILEREDRERRLGNLLNDSNSPNSR